MMHFKRVVVFPDEFRLKFAKIFKNKIIKRYIGNLVQYYTHFDLKLSDSLIYLASEDKLYRR